MPLKEDLKAGLVQAAKARDQVWLDTLRSLQSAWHYKEIEKRGDLTDAEALAVVSSLCKQRRESIEEFQKGGRADLAAKETRELSILQKFLPPQLSRGEVEAAVRKIIEAEGAKVPADLGRVMKGAMKELAGRADGKQVSEIAKALLS